MYYDAALEIAHTIWKNGLSLSALGTALYVLLRQKKVKRMLAKAFPWLRDDDSEIKEYVSNQVVIMENQRREMHNQRLIMETLVVEGWAAPLSQTSQLPSVTDGRKSSLKSICAARVRAVITGASTCRTERLYHSKTNEGSMITMKAYLKKLGSRKFQAFLAVTIPNMIIMFGFILGDIDLEGQVNQWMPAINLIIQAVATAIYQKIEGNADVARLNAGGTSDAKPYTDTDASV